MTEYDYSPDAIERHLAKQHQIAKWVDQTAEQSPCNPFVTLPDEHTAAQTPHPQPQPAFYATPQGVISPTYSSSRKHGHGHSQYGPGNTYVTIPQGYTPVAGRSFSNPPTPVRHFYSTPSTPYYNLYPTGSPLTPSPQGSPYHSPPISHPSHSPSSFHSNPSYIQAHPAIQQPHGGNPYFQPSYSQSSFHSAPSSHIQGNPVMHQQPGSYPYLQPQPLVVVRGDRSYVVVAAPGQQVQVMSPPCYEAQSRGLHQDQNFFGKLMDLGMKRSKSKKSKRSRRDSF